MDGLELATGLLSRIERQHLAHSLAVFQRHVVGLVNVAVVARRAMVLHKRGPGLCEVLVDRKALQGTASCLGADIPVMSPLSRIAVTWRRTAQRKWRKAACRATPARNLTSLHYLLHARVAGVLVLAATNRPAAVDAALLRPGRFDLLLYVPPPNEDGRLQTLAVHTRRMPLAADVDLAAVAAATDLYTGAFPCTCVSSRWHLA